MILLVCFYMFTLVKKPPKSIALINKSLNACQKVNSLRLKTSGIVVFHRYCNKRVIRKNTPMIINMAAKPSPNIFTLTLLSRINELLPIFSNRLYLITCHQNNLMSQFTIKLINIVHYFIKKDQN